MENLLYLCTAGSLEFICRHNGPDAVEIGESYVCETGEKHVQELVEVAGPANVSGSGGYASGRILRKAGETDRERALINRDVAEKARRVFNDILHERHIPLRGLKTHFSLRRERLVLWYSGEIAADVRQAVGQLQRRFGAKVEERLINPRQAAALMGGCGTCGRRLCCATWLKEAEPVSLAMARAQGLSLVPGALNGLCGCIKCCVQFEHNQYQ